MSLAPQPKQLKKNDFLAHVSNEPMTRGDVVDALDEYSFIDSYIDFLINHFAAQGKIIKNEDGTIQRKAKKAAADRTIYRVDLSEDGEYVLESRTLEPGETLDKESGWATTEKRAVKNRVSEIFNNYQTQVAAVKGLLATEDEAEAA